MTKFIVVAYTFGDGSADYGFRLWSHEFQSQAAAEEAVAFLKTRSDTQACIIEDYPSKPAAEKVAA